MTAIIRDSFRTNTLNQLINFVNTQSLYLGVGRSEPWNVNANSDSNLPIPENTVSSINSDWEDMIAMKRISSSNISIGMVKETWNSNTIYDTFRHDWNGIANGYNTNVAYYNGLGNFDPLPSSIDDVKCFVINSNHDVFVCIKRPSFSTPSLYSPETGVSLGNSGLIKTADGYCWKFLANNSMTDWNKYSNIYYSPIKTVITPPAINDQYYQQWISQQTSALYKGGIYCINVISAGSGYNSNGSGIHTVTDSKNDSAFKVIGNGTGFQCVITYVGNGTISDIEVINPGTGYTYASIILSGGNGAILEIIYTSMIGLGCDPVRDTNARRMLINMTLTGNEGSVFTVMSTYRKIMLILNPLNIGTQSSVAISTYLDATQTLNIGGGILSSAFPIDSIVTGLNSMSSGRVVDFDSTLGKLRIIRTSNENSGNNGASNAFISNEILSDNIGVIPVSGWPSIISVDYPQVAKYSGDIIYSEYIYPITRHIDQTDSFNVIIKI